MRSPRGGSEPRVKTAHYAEFIRRFRGERGLKPPPLSILPRTSRRRELCAFGHAAEVRGRTMPNSFGELFRTKKIKGGNDMEIIQTQTRDGEVRLEYKGLRLQVWANSTRKGWELWILHNEPKRFNTTLLGVERRTFKERTIMTKWVKSLR